MDIKEIALRVAEESGAVGYSPAPLRAVRGYSFTYEQLQNFAEALIESYKAELLKEVGEPVAVTNQAQLGYVTDGMHPDIPLAMWAKETSYSGANIALYTSDQLAAAIIKATKPLEDQLAAAQEEIKTVTEQKNRMWFEMQTAQDQLATAEQRVAEWQPIDTAPKNGQSYLAYSTEFVNQYWVTDKCNGMTHWMPLPKAPNGASS